MSSGSNSSYMDVVVIGNGPSAITLSLMLSGHWPYYDGKGHPNEYLHERLTHHAGNKSLVEYDLEELSSGLQGRSMNPVSVLLDQLQHPDADLGSEIPSTLEWKFHPDRRVEHVVLGRGQPGGAWDTMRKESSQETLTVSLGSWMQLPMTTVGQWMDSRCKMLVPFDDEFRMSLPLVAKYYKDYVKEHCISKNFRNHTTVTQVRFDDHCQLWRVSGYEVKSTSCSKYPGSGCETKTKFQYLTPRVVLAIGNSDTPNMLHVPGENLSFVAHSLSELSQKMSELDEETDLRSALESSKDPILIVGAGLSSADAIINVIRQGYSVVHVFRRHPEDPALIFNQLPECMYPEYHEIHSMMKGRHSKMGSYRPLPLHCVSEIRGNKEVLITNLISAHDTEHVSTTTVRISLAAVLIGMKPDLSFIRPKTLRDHLGIKPNTPVSVRSNPLAIHPYTHESLAARGLYALGPLVGDNFVRFVQGGSLAVVSHIAGQLFPDKREAEEASSSNDVDEVLVEEGEGEEGDDEEEGVDYEEGSEIAPDSD